MLQGTSGGQLAQPSCSSRNTYRELLRTVSTQLFSISKDGDATIFLDNLCQWQSLSQEKMYPQSEEQREPAVFVLIASDPVTGHNHEEPGSVLCTLPSGAYTHE